MAPMTDDRLALVLVGEIENALRDLGGTGQGLKTLGDQVVKGSEPPSKTIDPPSKIPVTTEKVLQRIIHERNQVVHEGTQSRKRYDEGQPLFSDGFIRDCTRVRDELRKVLTATQELSRICEHGSPGSALLVEQIKETNCLSEVLNAMAIYPRASALQEKGTAALLTFTSTCFISWDGCYLGFMDAKFILDAVIDAMSQPGSTIKVQKDGCAVISKLTNANIVQVFAQSDDEVFLKPAWQLFSKSLRAVVSALRKHPTDLCVQTIGLRALGDLLYGQSERKERIMMAREAGADEVITSALTTHKSMLPSYLDGSGVWTPSNLFTDFCLELNIACNSMRAA